MNWAEKLNKTELDHLLMACNGHGTLEAFKQNRLQQAEFARQVTKLNPQKPCNEICHECKNIAVKLGLENW